MVYFCAKHGSFNKERFKIGGNVYVFVPRIILYVYKIIRGGGEKILLFFDVRNTKDA